MLRVVFELAFDQKVAESLSKIVKAPLRAPTVLGLVTPET